MVPFLVQGRVRKLNDATRAACVGAGRYPSSSERRRRLAVPLPPSLPASADLRALQSPVWDQGARHTCTGYAWRSGVEYLANRVAQRADAFVPLSAYSLYFATRVRIVGAKPEIDPGALNADVATAIATYGIATEATWPDDELHFAVPPPLGVEDASHRKGQLCLSLPTLRHIKASLAQRWPVILGFVIPASAATTGNLALPTAQDPIVGAHDALAVGFDDKSRRVTFKNSWGSSWGDAGYGTLDYSYFGDDEASDLSLAFVNEAWAIHSVESEGT